MWYQFGLLRLHQVVVHHQFWFIVLFLHSYIETHLQASFDVAINCCWVLVQGGLWISVLFGGKLAIDQPLVHLILE
jgi:hypothetical protein